MEAILYKVDGTEKKIKVDSFVEGRKIVCGYDANGLAEIVRLHNGTLFMIDEEGKLKKYPINEKATSIAHLNEAIYPHDCLVGDVLLFESENDFEELKYE
jgi:hypothetical protein